MKKRTKRKDPGPQPQRYLGADVPGAVKAKHPGFIPPQLAVLRDIIPTSNGWIFEIKLDGYRMQASRKDADPQIISRNGLDWTDKFSFLEGQLPMLPAREIILD